MTTTQSEKKPIQEYIQVMKDFWAGKYQKYVGLPRRQFFRKIGKIHILDNLTEADVDELLRLKYETGMSAWVLKNQIREREAKKAAATKKE